MANLRNRLILVSGATGRQGGAVLRALRKKGFPVRALTRDPDSPKARALVGQGTEIVRGNLNDKGSLTRAMDGVYGVYSVQSRVEEGIEGEIRQGIDLADAAKRSRISHLVYSSVASADQKTGVPHFDSKFRIEEHIRGTGLHYTIFRPVFFMENWLAMRDQIDRGELKLPLDPATRLQMIAADDIGVFVALAFEHSGKWQGRTMEIAGDELTMEQLTQGFSRVLNREVSYQPIPWDEFQQSAGEETTRMYHWFQETGYHVDIPAVRQEHPGLLNFDRWLRAKWLPAPARAGGR